MKKILSLCVALLAATQMFASFVPKFGENGKCTISLSDLKATDGVTIDAKAGTITSDGKGEFYLDLPAEGVDLSACTNLTVDHEGDDIVQLLLVEDAKSGKVGGFYSSKYNLDLTKYADKTSAVNKMEWHCNVAGTMTVKSITLTKKVESHFQYKADEIALTEVFFHAWSAPTKDGEDQGKVPCTLALNQELSAGGLVYGNVNVDYLQYAPLDGFKEIRIYGDPGLKYRVLLNRETAGGKLVELDPEGDENGLAVCDISSLPYVHLNAIKLAWGSSKGVVKGLCVSTTATGIRECHVANEQDIIASYNLAGQKVNRNAKGLILQKTKDGKVIKRIVR